MKKTLLVLILPLWLVLVVAGMALLWHYETDSGPLATAPIEWPSDSSLSLDKKLPTLMMFVHPHCPCTRASVDELALLAAQVQGLAQYGVAFLAPPEKGREWIETDLWRSVKAIPDVAVIEDVGGVEARRFEVETSGNILLYDPKGRLLFNGGITPTRGHAGDNQGRDSLTTLLSGKTEPGASKHESLVFGCPLFRNAAVCSRCEMGDSRARGPFGFLVQKIKRIYGRASSGTGQKDF